MRCATARKLVSDYIDNNLDSGQSLSLKQHLEGCPGCKKVLEDFQKIAEGARELEEVSPSGQAWFKIQAKLKVEKQEAQAPTPRTREKFHFLFSPPRLRYVVSAVAALALIVIAITFRSQQGKQSGTLAADSQNYALSKLEEAEHHYQLAIKALWEAVSSQEKDFDPQLLAVFRKNLEIIDASLVACRQVVLDNPDNVESRNYMLALYKGKADLLADMVNVSTNSSQKQESKTTL